MKKLIALTLLACTCAHAEFYNGNDLLRMMRGSTSDQISAMGYVTGVADALHKVSVCVPNGVTAGQVNDVVKAFLEATPSVRHFSADSVSTAALQAVWPCKRGQSL